MKEIKRYWVGLFIAFACVSAGFFFVFFQKGISFVHYGDAYYQHLPALEYYSEWLKIVARNIIHLQSIPSYSLSIGYGGDILTTLNYYGIGDPLNLLVVFANKYNIVYFYNGLIIVRLFLAGVFFSFFLKEKGYILDVKVLCGTILYCFSGWAIVAPLTHIFFGTILTYLPILLWGSERVIKGKSNRIFILGLFFLAISNFYFLYVGVIVTAIYVVVEHLMRKELSGNLWTCIIKHLHGGIIALSLSAT